MLFSLQLSIPQLQLQLLQVLYNSKILYLASSLLVNISESNPAGGQQCTVYFAIGVILIAAAAVITLLTVTALTVFVYKKKRQKKYKVNLQS